MLDDSEEKIDEEALVRSWSSLLPGAISRCLVLLKLGSNLTPKVKWISKVWADNEDPMGS